MVYLFIQPFPTAARAAAISFCPQEMYLVVGFLSFPVSFLQKNISVFVRAAADKKDVVSQVETDKNISHHRPRLSQGQGELRLTAEITDFRTYFPGAIFLLETVITSST